MQGNPFDLSSKDNMQSFSNHLKCQRKFGRITSCKSQKVFGKRIVDATMGWYVQRGQELKIERDRMREEERLKKRDRESEKELGSEDEEDETREIAIGGAEEELNDHGYYTVLAVPGSPSDEAESYCAGESELYGSRFNVS